jgi:hypothetical protein
MLLKFMASIPRLGGINIDRKINEKLKEEIVKIDKDINELLKNLRHTEPAYYTLAPAGIESIASLIKRILDYIERYKKSLTSYGYNLYHFSEINQLENSLREIPKILKEGHQQIYNPSHGMKMIQIIQNINQSIEIRLSNIQHLWNIHKNKLHRLGIIK